MFFLHSFAGESFVVVILDRFFLNLGIKKAVAGSVRQVVILYSNNWTGICLGRFSIGHFTEVVVWTGLTVML